MGTSRVQLHVAAIDKLAAAAMAGGLGWLTEVEAGRLQAMRAQARRDSFLAGHWQARKLVARWLGVRSARISLASFADGRPLVCLDDDPVPLSLSLSHSGDWLAVALGEVAVGVDVELPRRLRDIDALAGFMFSRSDQQRLQAADAGERERVFLELWALNEARVKRTGEGLHPRASRELGVRPCDTAGAQVLTWRFRSGALALALTPGAQVGCSGTRLDEACGWRYL